MPMLHQAIIATYSAIKRHFLSPKSELFFRTGMLFRITKCSPTPDAKPESATNSAIDRKASAFIKANDCGNSEVLHDLLLRKHLLGRKR